MQPSAAPSYLTLRMIHPGMRSEELPEPAIAGRVDAEAHDAIAAARGDVAAFERLYRLHVGRIQALARRILGPGDADDGTQDVFIRAWDKLGTFRGQSAFGTWLYRLAINVLLARRETLATWRRRHEEDDGTIAQAPSRRDTPEFSLDFEAAVERLPTGMREIFVLHDVEGFKHEEIARMLGIAVGTSKSQLHRVRIALRKYLDPERIA